MFWEWPQCFTSLCILLYLTFHTTGVVWLSVLMYLHWITGYVCNHHDLQCDLHITWEHYWNVMHLFVYTRVYLIMYAHTCVLAERDGQRLADRQMGVIELRLQTMKMPHGFQPLAFWHWKDNTMTVPSSLMYPHPCCHVKINYFKCRMSSLKNTS